MKNERKASFSWPPHPLLFFSRLPCYLLFLFFHKHHRCLFGFIYCNLDWHIHRDLCLCTSFLVRIAGGGAAPSPLHPPTRFYFLIGSPCYLLFLSILFVFHKHHRLFGYILSLLISIEICAYVLLSWYALRGEALRPPPCTPHPLLFLNWLPLLPTLFHFF